jgi:hypothetical protein
MAIIVALLVGLTVSAEEIFRDQKTLRREKFLHLSRFSYLLSKLAILFSMSMVQSLFLCLVGKLVLEIPGNPLPFLLMIFSVFCAANLMGLILSSSFNSPVTIYIIIPLVVIPQMLLGGAMFRFSRLNEMLGGSENSVPPISNVMVSRWAYEGILVNEFKSNNYERDLFAFDKIESKLNYHISYVIPKLEELMEKQEKDTMLTKTQKQFLSKTIANVLKQEYTLINAEYGPVKVSEDEDTTTVLKQVLNRKMTLILDKKDAAKASLEKRGIREDEFTNESTVELVTNALEKHKIVLDSANYGFVQIIDPVFREPANRNELTGMKGHFYAPAKVVSGKSVSTFSYNLGMIWILNLVAFLLLYFDVFRLLFRLFEPGRFRSPTTKA